MSGSSPSSNRREFLSGRALQQQVERAGDRLSAFDEAYVVIEGDNALRAAKDLRGLLGAEMGGGAGDELDDDEDLDDEEDEDFDDEDEES